MPRTFRCSNPQCPNRDRGNHLTARAAAECSPATPALLPASRSKVFAPHSARPLSLSDIAEARALGEVTDEDIVRMPSFSSLDAEGRDVLLDLVASDSSYANEHASGDYLVDYIAEANTGHNSLTAWAEEEMTASPPHPPGESPENYAEKALVKEIWVLPRRDNPEQYRVMRRV